MITLALLHMKSLNGNGFFTKIFASPIYNIYLNNLSTIYCNRNKQETLHYICCYKLFRNINKQIYTETLNTPRHSAELLRDDQSGCQDVDMTSPLGYWVLQNRWEWVVDGCNMKPITPDKANQCIQNR